MQPFAIVLPIWALGSKDWWQDTSAEHFTFTTTNMHFDLGMSSEMVMYPFGYKSTLSLADSSTSDTVEAILAWDAALLDLILAVIAAVANSQFGKISGIKSCYDNIRLAALRCSKMYSSNFTIMRYAMTEQIKVSQIWFQIVETYESANSLDHCNYQLPSMMGLWLHTKHYSSENFWRSAELYTPDCCYFQLTDQINKTDRMGMIS